MSKLVIIRHGQSIWNLENRFTGWVDVPLSTQGIEEAKKAGKLISDIKFDIAFTSVLVRAIDTLIIACANMRDSVTPVFESFIPEVKKMQDYSSCGNELRVIMDPALNERNYGELQGLNKKDTAETYGAEQVQAWRRSYDHKPLNETGESLKDTVERALPYYHEHILPLLKEGKNVLVVAHGNSLRALSMELDDLNEEQIPGYEIATGVPIVYEIDSEGKVLTKNILNF
ncbi:MAG: 2,3-bisphosphoglycerate-dependent phosphoglycerate mutase [Candidatus Gracilibacteria bacterium]|nr:2,3-bisphosphoglycerate-dependent phosphoglycerate mutase [Candidatus Gracilibacteria bacterium]